VAAAKKNGKVVLFEGDGSLLMQLGSLVTISGAAPANLFHFVFENGVYETSGSQPLPEGLLMGLLGPVVGRLYDRFGARVPLVPGTVATSLSLWSATLLDAHSPVWLILVFHLLLSAGLAFAFTPLFTAEETMRAMRRAGELTVRMPGS